MILASFLLFLAGFAVVGLWSMQKSRKTQKDYFIASQQIPPWLVGLSAVATNNSGYMFIGVIGYTYSTGLASIWLMLGWLTGDFLGSVFIHKKLREATQRQSAQSYISALSQWQGDRRIGFQRLAAVVAFIFLMAYASAQLVAGSKALMVLLGWPAFAGAVVGALIVLVYCWAGGIRASIWTDAAQSLVMIFAMSVLLFVAVRALGGLGGAYEALNAVPHYMDWIPQNLLLPGVWGLLLFVLGWLFAGLSVVGQPHVMVRFMALKSSGGMGQARAWYYSWFTAFYFMATAVGLLSRVLLPDTAQFDAELALPTLALQLLPAVLVGLILAGVFAATMSTADSLVLACSSIIANDLALGQSNLTRAKVATVAVTFGALLWALSGSQSVFNLVVMAWSTLAAAFVPILLLLTFRQRFSEACAIFILLTGVAVSLGWRWLGWHSAIYEGAPAIVLALLVFPLVTRLFPLPSPNATMPIATTVEH